MTPVAGPGERFCVLPWVHLCGSIDGVWGRCCIDASMYHDDVYAEAEPNLGLPEDAIGCVPGSVFAGANPDRVFGIEDAFNSDAMRRTRLAMLADEPVAACEYCYHREAGGGESYRQKMNKRFAADIPARTAETRDDGSLPLFPTFLDIRFGNACNLACIMCGYPVSSKWGLAGHPSWAPTHIDPYRDDVLLWATLREHASDLQRIYFAGGEPFLQSGHFRMLDLMIDSGDAEHIEIRYHSNLTVLPDGIFTRLAHFESVSIGASCDGVDAVFERIRVGARWDTFVAHLRLVKRHVPVWLSVTPQRDNVMTIGSIIEFALAEDVPIDLTNLLQWPAELSIQSMSDDRKSAATLHLRTEISRCLERGMEETADQVAMIISFMNASQASYGN